MNDIGVLALAKTDDPGADAAILIGRARALMTTLLERAPRGERENICAATSRQIAQALGIDQAGSARMPDAVVDAAIAMAITHSSDDTSVFMALIAPLGSLGGRSLPTIDRLIDRGGASWPQGGRLALASLLATRGYLFSGLIDAQIGEKTASPSPYRIAPIVEAGWRPGSLNSLLAVIGSLVRSPEKNHLALLDNILEARSEISKRVSQREDDAAMRMLTHGVVAALKDDRPWRGAALLALGGDMRLLDRAASGVSSHMMASVLKLPRTLKKIVGPLAEENTARTWEDDDLDL